MKRYCKYIALAAALLTAACSQDTILEEDILQDIPTTRTADDDTVFTAKKYIESYLRKGTEGYQVMFRAIEACGLLDTLSVYIDPVYEEMYQMGQIPDLRNYQDKVGGDKSATSGDPDAHAPEHRKIGFTIFAETDDFWRSQGLDPNGADLLKSLCQWIKANGMLPQDDSYTSDDNYSSPKHLLYKWVTYHILPMKIPANKLVYHCNEVGYIMNNPTDYSIPVYEWYCTMGERRLLKIFESKESNGIYLNRFPILDNGIFGTGHETACMPDCVGCLVKNQDEAAVTDEIENACIYPIDAPLAYSDEVREHLGSERIRFDLMSLLPEAITNGFRRADSSEGRYQHVYIPSDNVYRYFDNLSIGQYTYFVHYNGYKINWTNYCQDEQKAVGPFDVTIKLPPVPVRGTYEFRYKVLTTSSRGLVQVYFGTSPDNLKPAGLPVDLTKGLAEFSGSYSWSDLDDWWRDEEQILEIDHKLRNHGVMKAARHEVHEADFSRSARDDSRCCRRILLEQTLDPDKTYYVRFKNALDSDRKELYLDYFELCPKSVYHNRYQPEDIW